MTPITITREENKLCLTQENKTLMTGDLINFLIIVTFNQPVSNLTMAQQNWHLRLGHPRNQTLKSLGLHLINKEQYCVHLDLVGPISPPSASGQKYFLTMFDQFTSYKAQKNWNLCLGLPSNQALKSLGIHPINKDNDPFEVNEDEEFYELSEEENPEEDTMPEEEENIVEDRTVYAEEERSAPAPKRIRVIDPRQPTLIHSDISQEKILPYGRQPVALLTKKNNPNFFNQALKSPDSEFWISVEKRELNSTIKLNFWEVIPIKEEYTLITTKWVFKTKRRTENEITEYNAHLCAQGFIQNQGVD
ncbi:hypothetical protein O181_029649 [Austropuccinia psidii MF-1]|uniref:Reverse transcriptase Ty1/copia-type domain-containing protein n=1 Tax=Austropuccinia psidii MF-1 TaxID=1389203 RepID=A0A9Q3CSN5_9BASI|nr:hypothetical protein [Austropuccinia psidii MF-1]